ncbi:hypothetical protein PPYR_01137 [Photinus pyralis]|uniref:Zinc finger protein ZPR1 n=1 Tax=Photinus pyralis TaxID=7054 RepID=A0A1Y1M8V9_PHOPY|nr:zinc finger protein ZPR1 [Photinus pyralis]KAB0804167.1 hypothetical protein PPYR_01137 [Photinus pyralis]
MSEKRPIFRDLNADDPEPETTEIESLCMNCQANGTTRLLLTKIPFYKEIVLMSFSCDECGYANNEIQPGGQLPDKGIQITLNVQTGRDLNRQVVKSDFASVKIVELEFEIPSKSHRGEVTTIESIINRSISDLEMDQPVRKIENEELAQQIDNFIDKLKKLKDVETPFTFILDDISGNSFIENPNAPLQDLHCTVKHFTRTKEQDHELGIFTKEEVGEKQSGILYPIEEGEFSLEDLEGEVLQFGTNCNSCGSPCETNMKLTNIPHFKEVVIMATVCDTCGNRTNEVKSGSGVEPLGVRIEVDVSNKNDLCRDLLKSETCHLRIPQLELEVGPSALGGRFTTVEGLLVAVKDQLSENIFQDSQAEEDKDRLASFLQQFDCIIEGKKTVTLVLDDPAGNSYVQSLSDVGEDDCLRITKYERNFDQNEELGLNDMKTENY